MQHPLFAATYRSCGITRLADHTALDTIGLPVFAAYRPNARSLSVCQGKGLTDDQARISALMEAVETALAEDAAPLTAARCSIDAFSAQGKPIVPLRQMMKCRDPGLDPSRERAWVEGRSLQTGQAVWAPYELVGLDMRVDAPWDRAFKMSSVGLAAHLSRDDAVLHGLLEAIEYDALALALAWPGIVESLPRIVPDDALSEGLAFALGKVRDAGLTAEFVDITSDIGIPAMLCLLGEAERSRMVTRKAPFAGHACRFDPEDAMLAALLEAVQSRMTDISGARDDIEERDYDLAGPGPAAAAIRRTQSLKERKSRFGTGKQRNTPGQQIEAALKLLLARGIDDAYVFTLSRPASEIACVSVLCPLLEAGTAREHYRTDIRTLSRISRFALGLT